MKRLCVVLAVTAAAGCASSGGASRGGATVSDADFGRLQAGQLGPVEQARQFRDSAKDEQARAKLRLQDGQHEDELARADEQSAKAWADRAAAQQKIANESRDPAQLEQARTMKEQADAQKRAADAHTDYAKKMLSARQSAVDAADKQVSVGDAKLELAKLNALQQAGIPAAGKYDLAAFQKRVDQDQKAFDSALQKTRDQESQAQAARQTWEDANRQAQAQAIPLGPQRQQMGTGSAQPPPAPMGTGSAPPPAQLGTGAQPVTPPPAQTAPPQAQPVTPPPAQPTTGY